MSQVFLNSNKVRPPLIAVILCMSLALASCQKEIHINLKSVPPTLVVQGQIETGQPPFVGLTTSFGYFSQVDLSTLQGLFVHGANVQVSNGSKTVTLKEYSFDTTGGNKFYVYSIDTTNLANLMIGETGKFYTLTIGYNGRTYTSLTKIPNPTPVDTAWFGAPLFTDDKTPKNAQQLFVNYTDPDTPGNYVRYFTKRNNGPYYGVGVFTDQVINGHIVTQIGLVAGFTDSTNVNGDSLRYFYPGDSVSLQWSTIDKGVFTFWNTYAFAQQSLGNPFSTPINITSNISNGALGIWAGYGNSFTYLVVPH